MRLKLTPYVAIVILVSFLITLGFSVYLTYRSVSPLFYIHDVMFRLGDEKRSVEFYVRVERGNIELDRLFVNGIAVSKWTADRYLVNEGEDVKCFFEYDWKMGREYNIRLTTTEGEFSELTAESPKVTPRLIANVKNVNVTLSLGLLRVNAEYEVYGEGIDSLHMILFTYASFRILSRAVYIFYDPDYMAKESIRRADVIISYFNSYGVSIYKIDYYALQILCRDANQSARRCILIIVNPLKDNLGRRIFNALPAPLVDPNENGILRDDSRHGKSFVYDLMADEGLILVTVGSLQPHKRILYRDGVYTWAKDSFEPFDIHLFFTNASGIEPIVKDVPFIHCDYTPVRISGTLGLSYVDTSIGFDKDAIERHGLEYYAYGEFRPFSGVALILPFPIFIRVGKGGLLAMGDEQLWLNDEQLAHDLFMIYLQAVWDSEWIPYGWYWDNGCTFYSCHGIIKKEDKLESELIPSNIVGDKLFVRIVGIAYSSDLNTGIVVEKIMKCQAKIENDE